MAHLLRICLLIALCATVTGFAQGQIKIEVGAHGGIPLHRALTPAFCCTTGTAFTSHETEDSSYLAGLSAGIFLYDRVHVAFGATYMPVSFRTTVTTCCPLAHPTRSTHGTSWEFPLLADYRWLKGSLSPFSGGGVVVYNRTSGGQNQSPAPVVSVGVEWMRQRFALRPEFRYIHYPQQPGANVEVGRPPTQTQILIGVSYRM